MRTLPRPAIHRNPCRFCHEGLGEGFSKRFWMCRHELKSRVSDTDFDHGFVFNAKESCDAVYYAFQVILHLLEGEQKNIRVVLLKQPG